MDLVSKSFSKFATTFTVLYDGSHFFMPDWETLDYLHTNLEPALLFLAQAIFNVLQNNATRLAVRAVVGKETKPPIKSIRASERLSKKQVPAARGNPRLEVASGGGEVYIKESSYNLVLDKLIPSLLSVSSPQLLHIGPGEGQEICQLIRALLVTDKAKMNYCGRIDIVAVEVVTR